MESHYYHSMDFNPDLCSLSMKCMRICPTEAIRIRENGVEFLEERCIDCGACIDICPSGAIVPKTDALTTFSNFKYKVAVPSPTLYTQFGKTSPSRIIEALKSIGFDDVFVLAWACDAISASIKEYVDKFNGKFPLISSSCPVIIRLIQVNYPEGWGRVHVC